MVEPREIYSQPDKHHGTVFVGTDVPVQTLLEYLKMGRTLDEFLGQFPKVQREHAVAFLEEATRPTKEADVDRVKKYDTVVSSGQAALKALMTLNGGATISFLTFIGHLGERGTLPVAGTGAFTSALLLFAWGTLSAVLGYGTIFLTNTLSLMAARKPDPRMEKVSDWMFVVTLLCGAAAVVCFIFASRSAVAGFGAVSVPAPVR